ncbi:hypothetical protein K1719_039945 [Acacia pycnantha]|nr:hypothetical protein K1719_039945 [Acacia pycnantha]
MIMDQDIGINDVCDNRVIRIDVGMSKSCINGLPEDLEIKGKRPSTPDSGDLNPSISSPRRNHEKPACLDLAVGHGYFWSFRCQILASEDALLVIGVGSCLYEQCKVIVRFAKIFDSCSVNQRLRLFSRFSSCFSTNSRRSTIFRRGSWLMSLSVAVFRDLAAA